MATHKICFDASTNFGWCMVVSDEGKDVIRPLGQRFHYGTWDLTRDNDDRKVTRRGVYYGNLMALFRELRVKHGLNDDKFQIYMEMETIGALRNESSAILAGGWLAIVELLCEQKGWNYPISVAVSRWRKTFIGRSNAPKEITGSNERRAWVKDEVLAECKRRGLNPQDDNAADAIGLMYWVLVGGAEKQAREREDKKAKKKENRGQKTLL